MSDQFVSGLCAPMSDKTLSFTLSLGFLTLVYRWWPARSLPSFNVRLSFRLYLPHYREPLLPLASFTHWIVPSSLQLTYFEQRKLFAESIGLTMFHLLDYRPCWVPSILRWAFVLSLLITAAQQPAHLPFWLECFSLISLFCQSRSLQWFTFVNPSRSFPPPSTNLGC